LSPDLAFGVGYLQSTILELNDQEGSMLYSTDRILTNHAGSLPRPPDLYEMVAAKANGEPYDPTAFEVRLKSAVAEVVLRQAECGIDV
jgi:5-methyltetrahydropteroyltriglutamate--homocysteine methyltransferase